MVKSNKMKLSFTNSDIIIIIIAVVIIIIIIIIIGCCVDSASAPVLPMWNILVLKSKTIQSLTIASCGSEIDFSPFTTKYEPGNASKNDQDRLGPSSKKHDTFKSLLPQ